MTPAELQQEQSKVFALMIIYGDRCRRVHNAVNHLSEQEYWTFRRDMEHKVLNNYFIFDNAGKARLQLLRALQTERDRCYGRDGAGALRYVTNRMIIQP
jgi:hypothetical protein